MFLPNFSECPAKGHKKSPNLKSRIKSFLSDLTPVRRTLVFSVILFHAFLLCYLILRFLTTAGMANVSPGTHNSMAKEGISNIKNLSFPNEGCDSGRIYVYDLPTMFNYDITNNCTDIEPPLDKCEKNLNGGLGPAATEFAGMLPESILPAFYWTDMYWGEVIFHNRMLNHKCRTLEPESATAFYIPFYGGLRLRKYLFSPYTKRDRDWHSEMLVEWLREQRWWKRSNGSDHFIMPAMRNVIPLSVERDTWQNHLGIAVPYPSIFHPRSESDVIEWQEFVRSRRRTRLFAYVGGGRPRFKNDFRETLKHSCLSESAACRHVDCAGNKCLEEKTAVMAAYLDGDFCLQPRGDGLARQAVFDCLVAGSIPVFFWRRTAYTQYEFSIFPSEPESYSVFIHRNDVRNGTNIRSVLERYGREEVKRMREKVIEYIPRFGYARPSRGLEKTKDAFDLAVDGVLTKYKDHMARGRLGNLNEM